MSLLENLAFHVKRVFLERGQGGMCGSPYRQILGLVYSTLAGPPSPLLMVEKGKEHGTDDDD